MCQWTMGGFTKLPSKEKSNILFHVCGLFLALTLVLYLIFMLTNVECQNSISARSNIDPYTSHFNAYLKKFGKSYKGDEFLKRFENFKKSLKEIKKLNGVSRDTAQYGLTKFSDMSQEEFEEKMLLPPSALVDFDHTDDVNKTCPPLILKDINHEAIPESFDWRDKKVVGPVLDQGICLSCWAFSVVGVMESMVVISRQSDHFYRLSIQELTDCSKYTMKCSCGNPALALKYLCNNKVPITTENEYPLTNMNQTCHLSPKSGVIITHYIVIYDMRVEDIINVIAAHGPVVTAVNSRSWKHYNGGIIQHHCGPNELLKLNHVVQIVGYDRSGPVPYFIMRNSWGRDFGDHGYLRVAITDDFLCGVGRQISYFNVMKI